MTFTTLRKSYTTADSERIISYTTANSERNSYACSPKEISAGMVIAVVFIILKN